MRLSDVLQRNSDLRESLAALGAQHIEAARVRLDDCQDLDTIRMEQARIAVWKDILKHVQQARNHEDKHGRRDRAA